MSLIYSKTQTQFTSILQALEKYWYSCTTLVYIFYIVNRPSSPCSSAVLAIGAGQIFISGVSTVLWVLVVPLHVPLVEVVGGGLRGEPVLSLGAWRDNAGGVIPWTAPRRTVLFQGTLLVVNLQWEEKRRVNLHSPAFIHIHIKENKNNRSKQD